LVTKSIKTIRKDEQVKDYPLELIFSNLKRTLMTPTS